MKHATKQEASAARLAALKASREKRTHAKHERWAQEMRAAGHVVILTQGDRVMDGDGSLWVRGEDGMYRLNSGRTAQPRTLAYIQETYGLAGDS
jgi:adenosylmethionine-8-amino-7-oxononanoate aminotransferase